MCEVDSSILNFYSDKEKKRLRSLIKTYGIGGVVGKYFEQYRLEKLKQDILDMAKLLTKEELQFVVDYYPNQGKFSHYEYLMHLLDFIKKIISFKQLWNSLDSFSKQIKSKDEQAIVEPKIEQAIVEPKIEQVIVESEIEQASVESEIEQVIVEPEIEPVIVEPIIEQTIAKPKVEPITLTITSEGKIIHPSLLNDLKNVFELSELGFVIIEKINAIVLKITSNPSDYDVNSACLQMENLIDEIDQTPKDIMDSSEKKYLIKIIDETIISIKNIKLSDLGQRVIDEIKIILNNDPSNLNLEKLIKLYSYVFEGDFKIREKNLLLQHLTNSREILELSIKAKEAKEALFNII